MERVADFQLKKNSDLVLGQDRNTLNKTSVDSEELPLPSKRRQPMGERDTTEVRNVTKDNITTRHRHSIEQTLQERITSLTWTHLPTVN